MQMLALHTVRAYSALNNLQILKFGITTFSGTVSSNVKLCSPCAPIVP